VIFFGVCRVSKRILRKNGRAVTSAEHEGNNDQVAQRQYIQVDESRFTDVGRDELACRLNGREQECEIA
jgi:hypothetical protein